jgi:ribosomal protein L11 methyltransferase
VNYIELKCEKPATEEQLDILIADLADLGFESFAEEKDHLLSYIPEQAYSEEILSENTYMSDQHAMGTLAIRQIEDQNWNAEWERSYEAVVIDERCRIRAPFHPVDNSIAFDVVIQPKMSFGTAHHETTALIISMLLQEEITGFKVLDMGCGTGVLAILSILKGAQSAVAIDLDEWAFNNTVENVALNNIRHIDVKLGDASLLGSELFHLILANINKNVLLNDMQKYAQVLRKGGRIIFSGFYTSDLNDIKTEAEMNGLDYNLHKEKNNWVAAIFTKN